MNRKEFLHSVAAVELSSEIAIASDAPLSSQPEASPSNFQNPLAARKLIRTTTGLGVYSGPWNIDTAVHVLRRTMFGPRRAEVLAVGSSSLGPAVASLMTDQPVPAPPRGPNGEDFTAMRYDGINDGTYRNYLKAWWLGLMVKQGISIIEKMTLFWHNHFANEAVDVQDSRLMYRQNVLFRRYALGNFKQLVKEVTLDPAMLVYLNGYLNRGDGGRIPDENYARELFELFTIGKGPIRGEGDYTHYTEQDVKAAARVLTGYSIIGRRDINNTTISSYFEPTRHDATNKVFSSAFENRVITGRTGTAGAQELDDLINMIFAQRETARYICRKLYRWFIYYDIDSNAERNVIEPMADILIQNDFEIKPALEALLKSEHFYDVNNVGCYIRTPIDVVVGTIRQMSPQGLPDLSLAANYSLANSLRNSAAVLGMNLFDPPDVAGWKAYYQIPDFYELWINTTTLPSRGAYTDSLINSFRAGGTTYRVDPIAYVRTMSSPSDPIKLVNDLSAELSPISLTTKQKEHLLYDDPNILGLARGSEYSWTELWNNYNQFPNNAEYRDTLTRKLNNLLKFMLRLAEAQLA